MNRPLFLTLALLFIANAALADQIGIFSDATGTSCNLGAAGQLSSTATVIHKFATGATGSRFKISFPPGTTFLGFNTPYLCGIPGCNDGQTYVYGPCLTGSIVIGTILAIYAPGAVKIVPPGTATVQYVDCFFGEYSATGGTAYVGTGADCDGLPVESSTWGNVKALYR